MDQETITAMTTQQAWAWLNREIRYLDRDRAFEAAGRLSELFERRTDLAALYERTKAKPLPSANKLTIERRRARVRVVLNRALVRHDARRMNDNPEFGAFA